MLVFGIAVPSSSKTKEQDLVIYLNVTFARIVIYRVFRVQYYMHPMRTIRL